MKNGGGNIMPQWEEIIRRGHRTILTCGYLSVILFTAVIQNNLFVDILRYAVYTIISIESYPVLGMAVHIMRSQILHVLSCLGVFLLLASSLSILVINVLNAFFQTNSIMELLICVSCSIIVIKKANITSTYLRK